jgi:hypothetical protein
MYMGENFYFGPIGDGMRQNTEFFKVPYIHTITIISYFRSIYPHGKPNYTAVFEISHMVSAPLKYPLKIAITSGM